MRALSDGVAFVALTLLLTGCPAVPEEDARAGIQQAFEQANPPGRTGIELVGKAVWLRGPMFQDSCLHAKDLAFTDDPKSRARGAKDIQRITPTYQNQRFITGFTEKGWCVYVGDSPSMQLGEGSWSDGRWSFDASFAIQDPTAWFECLTPDMLQREVIVRADDAGHPEVETDMSLFADSCPKPLPGGEERRAAVRPSSPAPRPPTPAQARVLLDKFDQALYDRDYQAALALVSCYNLYEEQKYGTCSVAELITLASLPRGSGPRPEDGPSWTQGTADSLDALGAIQRDRDDPTLFHVEVKSRRGGDKRTLALQWVRGEWKLVGVVGLQAEDITTMRFIYDLHRKEKREIFERRMQGEQIDEKGNPVDPYAESEQ